MNKKMVITLTSSESKRLLAKAIVKLPNVKNAYENGILSIQLSTSNAYIYEELTDKSINKNNHVCGYIFDQGGCTSYLPGGNKREYYFEKGVEKYINFPMEGPVPVLRRMTGGDVIIKSGNILDRHKRAGVIVGEPEGNGGEWGVALPYVLCKGIDLIVPMTLNKSAHVDLEEVMQEVGMGRIDQDYTHTIGGVLPIPGQVITEIDAFDILFGVKALPVAMGGVGTGEGTVTLSLSGERDKLQEAWVLVTSIKGEPMLEVTHRCGECLAIKNNGVCHVQKKLLAEGKNM